MYRELNNPDTGLSLALGFFDGVHKGHQAVVKNAVQFAKQNNTKSAVITFLDHPMCVLFGTRPEYLLSKEDRIKMLKEHGVDYVYMLDFDKNLSTLTAQEYLDTVIISNFKPIAITTGFNHTFGSEKNGDALFLFTNQNKYKYTYFEIEPVKVENIVVSSTKIRESLLNADMELAASLLSYNFFIRGEVVRGRGLGTKLGFPTANIKYPKNIIKIPTGVYASSVEIDGEKYSSILNYGSRPTVEDNGSNLLEVHVLGYEGDLYGKDVKVSISSKLRDEMKFKNIGELKSQIIKDICLMKKRSH